MESLFYLFLFFCGFYLFMSYGFHYFIMVISLEILMLVSIVFFVWVDFSVGGMYYFIYFLVLIVCMGSYGLTLIMSFYRFLGSDTFFY